MIDASRFRRNIDRRRQYVMVDNFIRQSGPLANLRGWVHGHGGIVVGAVGLTTRHIRPS